MGQLALIALGSNLGDRKATLDEAVQDLSQTPEIVVRSVSTYHETRPVSGPVGQGSFLNAAVSLETTLEPLPLLHRLQSVETSAGRVRTVRWGERTLDLDLLLFGDQIIDTAELSVPHPRMAVRRFVLVPLEEIAAEVRDPLTGRSISELRANLDRRPSYLALEGWWSAPEKRPAFEQVVTELKTGCWSVRDLEQIAGKGWLGDSGQKPFGLLDMSLEFLASPDIGVYGDRWIVTDFSLTDLVSAATAKWGPPSQASQRSLVGRLAARKLDLLEPTFIVSEKTHRDPWPGSEALLRSTPRLNLDSTEPEQQVAEILTACAATRT